MGPFLEFLTRDGRIILAGRGVRGLSYGFVSVLLATYLGLVGADEAVAGIVLGVALLSGAALNIAASRFADRVGRRRFLALSGLLMFGSGVLLAATGSLEGAVAAALTGALTPTAMEIGPFLSVEQAMLPQASTAKGRTDAYAWYNLVGSFSAAVGALLTGLAGAFAVWMGGDLVAGIHLMFLWYAGTGLVAVALSLSLSPAVEVHEDDRASHGKPLSPKSRAAVSKMVALFAVDSFAGGMIIRTFTAYWFTFRFPSSSSVEVLGLIFFGANTLSAVSYLGASRLSKRLGLIRAMVYPHILSNLLLIAMALAPNFEAGVLLFFARMSLAQMDVAPRQQFVVAAVKPRERTAAAGITNSARSLSQAGGPFIIGPLVAAGAAAGPAIAIGGPFIAAGVLKIAYDLTLLRTFGTHELVAETEAPPPSD